MSYKVEYYTLAKMPDGRVGNIKQSSKHCFTDIEISMIPEALEKHLEKDKLVAIIQKIEDVGGVCI